MITQSIRMDGALKNNTAGLIMDEMSKYNVRGPRNGNGRSAGTDGDTGKSIDGDLSGQHYRIHDLIDIVEVGHREEQEIIVIDGRAYERIMKPGEVVFDLDDVVQEGCHDEVIRKISEIAERVAREIIPGIAEKIIKEEIEKLKR